MRSRGFVLALLLLAAAVGCRDLVQPDPPPPPERFVQGILRDPRGIIMPAAELVIWNTRYVEYEDRLEWRGTTDKNGIFTTDLPAPGLYDVEVRRATYTWLQYHRFLGVEFTGLHVTLAYPSDSQLVEIALPEDFPDPDFRVGDLRFARRILIPEEHGTTTEYTDARVADDGRFEAYLAPDRYAARLHVNSSGIHFEYSFPDSLDLPADSLLVLDGIPLIESELVLRLQGGAPPIGRFSVEFYREWGLYRTLNTIVAAEEGNPIWSFGGVLEMIVNPESDFPILTQRRMVDVQPGSRLEVELGRHLVVIEVETVEGQAVLGARVQLDMGSYSRERSTDEAGRAAFYLNPATYIVRIEQEGFQSSYELLEVVDQDLSVSYVLTPEQP